MLKKQLQRKRIHRKIRSQMHGTQKRPRLSVFRSSQHIYAQLIDDENGKVLVQASDIKMKGKLNKVARSLEVGKIIAKEAVAQKIEHVVFDRAGYIFHGRVKAVADGAREGGLKF